MTTATQSWREMDEALSGLLCRESKAGPVPPNLTAETLVRLRPFVARAAQSRLRRYGAGLDPAIVEDAQQDFWVVILEKGMAGYDPGFAPGQFVAKLMCEICGKAIRDRQRVPVFTDVDADDRVDRNVDFWPEDDERLERLTKALDILSDAERWLLFEHHVHGKRTKEIATQLGECCATVCSRLHRARAKLRDCIVEVER